jgi:peptide/nickel transport system ATP-binding protein/oligopeptide transport system ATP-binding protein
VIETNLPRPSLPAPPLLAVRDLSVAFEGTGRSVEAVRRVSFEIREGEILGLVGESGSGKSLTALSIVGLAPASASIGGEAVLAGAGDLLALPEDRLRQIRGGRIGFVFQEPMTALNPLFPIGFQIAEVVRAHRTVGRREARLEAIRRLEQVALPAAAQRLDDYPHQLSGGQRQRALLALALAGEPDLLLADEPTTSLDLTLQAQMLSLLLRLRDESGLAILLITHDLGVVAETCDRVAVMYAGEIVESAPVEPLFLRPSHPYTRALLANLTVQAGPGAKLPAGLEGR